MEVFAVTVFVSLMFAVLFAVLFLAEHSQRRHRSLEQEALLPLDEEEKSGGALELQKARALAGSPSSRPALSRQASPPLKL